MNAGAAAEGRGTAQKHPGTRRGKTNTAEGKVKRHFIPPELSHEEQIKKDGVEQNWLLTLLHPLQVGSHEERAEGEGDTAAGCNQKPFLQKPAGPESLADPRT